MAYKGPGDSTGRDGGRLRLDEGACSRPRLRHRQPTRSRPATARGTRQPTVASYPLSNPESEHRPGRCPPAPPQAVTRKTRILDVSYNASNNELVRTQTLVKNAIVQVRGPGGWKAMWVQQR